MPKVLRQLWCIQMFLEGDKSSTCVDIVLASLMRSLQSLARITEIVTPMSSRQ